MDKKQKIYVAVGGVAIALGLIYLMNRRDGNISDVVNAGVNNPFTSPYYTDGKRPGDGFVSNVEVNISGAGLTGLANQYMPVFGFVGVGVTGQLPNSILNVNTITNTTPPAAVVRAAEPAAVVPPAAVSGWTMTSASRRGGAFGGIGSTW